MARERLFSPTDLVLLSALASCYGYNNGNCAVRDGFWS